MQPATTTQEPADTVQVAYPSVVAPGLPAFTLDTPVGWSVGEFPGALIAAVAPEVEGRFRPNLMVAGRRVVDTLTLGEAADEAVAELEAVYGDVQRGERQTTVDSGAELLQQPLAYRLPDGTELAHLNVLLLLHDEIAPGAFRSLLGINAVCTAEQSASVMPLFQSVIGSMQLERRIMDVNA